MNPFTSDKGNDPFVDLLLYPNIGYTYESQKVAKLYYKATLGCSLGWHRDDAYALQFGNEPNLGLGLHLGYRF